MKWPGSSTTAGCGGYQIMVNDITDLGDAGGEGHEIKLTLFDDGSLIINSFNPDTHDSHQVVLLPPQWREVMKILIDTCGAQACPRFLPPSTCGAACVDAQS